MKYNKSDLITFSVRLDKDDVEKFKKCFGNNLSKFIRASITTVLNDGLDSFEKIYFSNTLKEDL